MLDQSKRCCKNERHVSIQAAELFRNQSSLTTCSRVAETYLEVKHTPPEISVGNIKTWGNFRPAKWTDAFTDCSPVSHSPARMLPTVKIQIPWWPKLFSIVSPLFSASRVCALTCFVRKEAQREEMDRQGGREKVLKMMREDERWCSLLITQMRMIFCICVQGWTETLKGAVDTWKDLRWDNNPPPHGKKIYYDPDISSYASTAWFWWNVIKRTKANEDESSYSQP